MSHTGQWTGRMKMAWTGFGLGAIMCMVGLVGEFMGKNMSASIGMGGSMVTLILGSIVAGKVAHDKGKV